MSNNVLMTLSWRDENGIETLFPFEINTAAWERLSQLVTRNWAVLDVIGARPLQQDLGPGLEEIRLDGTVYPHWRGGLIPLTDLRAHVLRSGPGLLIDGTGTVMQYWTLLSLDIRGDTPTQTGINLRQRFTLNLAYYGARPPQTGGVNGA